MKTLTFVQLSRDQARFDEVDGRAMYSLGSPSEYVLPEPTPRWVRSDNYVQLHTFASDRFDGPDSRYVYLQQARENLQAKLRELVGEHEVTCIGLYRDPGVGLPREFSDTVDGRGLAQVWFDGFIVKGVWRPNAEGKLAKL